MLLLVELSCCLGCRGIALVMFQAFALYTAGLLVWCLPGSLDVQKVGYFSPK